MSRGQKVFGGWDDDTKWNGNRDTSFAHTDAHNHKTTLIVYVCIINVCGIIWICIICWVNINYTRRPHYQIIDRIIIPSTHIYSMGITPRPIHPVQKYNLCILQNEFNQFTPNLLLHQPPSSHRFKPKAMCFVDLYKSKGNLRFLGHKIKSEIHDGRRYNFNPSLSLFLLDSPTIHHHRACNKE